MVSHTLDVAILERLPRVIKQAAWHAFKKKTDLYIVQAARVTATSVLFLVGFWHQKTNSVGGTTATVKPSDLFCPTLVST